MICEEKSVGDIAKTIYRTPGGAPCKYVRRCGVIMIVSCPTEVAVYLVHASSKASY